MDERQPIAPREHLGDVRGVLLGEVAVAADGAHDAAEALEALLYSPAVGLPQMALEGWSDIR